MLALLAQLRQGGAIDPLRAQDVGIVKLGQLLRREGLRWSVGRMVGTMHHHIELVVSGNNLGDCRIHGFLRGDVELDRMQIGAVLPGEGLDLGGPGRIAACRFAHRGVYRVPGSGQRVGCQSAETV